LARLEQLAAPDTELSAVVSEIAEALQQAHSEVRTLSFLLQPPWLEARGAFGQAIRDFVMGFARRAGLRAHVQLCRFPANLGRGRELTLFRVLQEALVNVHRHAHADEVSVEFSNSGKNLVLKVRDNGRGMLTAEGAAPTPGVGILGMQGRLRKFGGDLRIISAEDGATLVAKLPI
jgi:signal transduction histidine kinase